MILAAPDMDIPTPPQPAALASARALLQPPFVVAASPWRALGAAFLMACAGLAAAATVILCGPTLGDPSRAVHAPVSHQGEP